MYYRKENAKKFAKSVVFNFIRTNKNIKICPNLKCNFSIKVQDNIPKEIICECGYIFCFSCLNESHIPCSCEMVKQWNIYNEELKKNYSESIDKHGENFLWINENTKQCPNCGVSIEKNQGCNHMTCRKTAGGCGYEFCWICLNDFHTHNFKKCEYNSKQLIKNKNQFTKKIKNLIKGELDKFIKYYNGWKNIEDKDDTFFEEIQERIDNYKEVLVEYKSIIENGLNFLDEALRNIINCNRSLKYIFIFGYFLNDKANITLFEYNYQFLRNQNDLLLELIELEDYNC